MHSHCKLNRIYFQPYESNLPENRNKNKLMQCRYVNGHYTITDKGRYYKGWLSYPRKQLATTFYNFTIKKSCFVNVPSNFNSWFWCPLNI